LILRADQDLPYGDVRELFARAQKVGFPGMALMVGEKHRHAGPTTSQSGDTAG
jgi:biopolymer transport protein ExbD